ncbi:hypothetical protein IQ249_05700 [Lusitaniella coriacea LEGE 07157]|uniref:Uncharacterized protein n=1 Tax=Lusitaniella coriacea LEGE 07157 TaxID=945747 RepID=A0A8J7B8E5_9CYAN|nr:hypothetical protein [Lusitaniella coriacea]MBE9115390.1 hypothetical protein [Lusitaniella coriacea LEGE 07157]
MFQLSVFGRDREPFSVITPITPSVFQRDRAYYEIMRTRDRALRSSPALNRLLPEFPTNLLLLPFE